VGLAPSGIRAGAQEIGKHSEISNVAVCIQASYGKYKTRKFDATAKTHRRDFHALAAVVQPRRRLARRPHRSFRCRAGAGSSRSACGAARIPPWNLDESLVIGRRSLQILGEDPVIVTEQKAISFQGKFVSNQRTIWGWDFSADKFSGGLVNVQRLVEELNR
jgi:hypothetical protein